MIHMGEKEKKKMEIEKMNASNDCKDDDEALPPGFRFHPTDEELVGFYLRRKVEKRPISIEIIKQIDIYKYDPWDLPISSIKEKEWYFFCIRGRKYRNSVRPNRVTGSGFWKATGIDRPIYSTGDTHDCIGLKKSLVYYRGSAGKGKKTDWMMHEFRLPIPKSCDLPDGKSTTQEAEVWTLCRILKRKASLRKYASDDVGENAKKSKTCTFDPSSAVNKENAKKPINGHLYERNQLSVATQAPFLAQQMSCEFFRGYENWDELTQIVDLALDPSFHINIR